MTVASGLRQDASSQSAAKKLPLSFNNVHFCMMQIELVPLLATGITKRWMWGTFGDFVPTGNRLC